MVENLYDASKHIDLSKIESMIDPGKKLICFGAGTATRILYEKLLYKYNVYCILDNNKKLQGMDIYGIHIESPAVLSELEKGSYIILILNRYADLITKQLCELGLEEKTDFFDAYNEFEVYFRIQKFIDYAVKFEEFIKKAEECELDHSHELYASEEDKREKRIGIVCICEMLKTSVFYSLSQAILLYKLGYSTTLIIDSLYSFNDYVYFDKMTEIAAVFANYFAKEIAEKFHGIQIEIIDGSKTCELTDFEISEAKKYSRYSLKWYDARRTDGFLNGHEDRNKIAEEIMFRAMASVKYFVEHSDVNIMYLQAASHKHRWVYTHFGFNSDIRVASYDGSGDIALIGTESVCGWRLDTTRILEESFFSEEETEKILTLAKNNFNQRRSSTYKDEGYNYQKCGYAKDVDYYDVIIPMNIFWDSAALGMDRVFTDEVEWLTKTLEYIMENTDCTVMVREHPAQYYDETAIYRQYRNELPICDKYPNRIRYVLANEDVNSYQYIENSKLVLPFTSTIGMESALLLKPVIMHTNAFYRIYLDDANTEDEYFDMIDQYLKKGKKPEYDMDKLYLAYFYQVINGVSSCWSEGSDKWMDYSIEELLVQYGVTDLLNVVINNIPILYWRVKE